jgi:hypothetical protein
MKDREFPWRMLLLGVVLLCSSRAERARCQTATAFSGSETSKVIKWSATWISHPTAPLREPITLHFKRTFPAPQHPKHFIIHVSADNRFVLYLNGNRVGTGPARGDLAHWRYETFDLAGGLLPGENTLSATVWNFGVYAPLAQVSDRTAFLVQGDSDAESIVNTDARWFVETEPGQTAYPRKPDGFWQYMVVGPGEMLDAALYDWGWQSAETTNGRWVAAASAVRESIYPTAGLAGPAGTEADNAWQLVPDPLPPMSYAAESAGHVVRSDLDKAAEFPGRALTVPARTHTHILLDRGSITTAYPRLEFSDGKGAEIEMVYSEALYDAKGQKGDRDEVGTRQAQGERDRVLPDGGEHRSFEPLWWRTWRYVDIEVTTKESPLVLQGFSAKFTAYPFEADGWFHSDDAELNSIWEIGWHTLQLDAHETFADAPYFEQLQYVGDSRVEAMITYSVSRDDRLARQAIVAIDQSRRPDGLTASRYPSSLPQYIPPFSLLWIGMVHDYAGYHNDPAFVRERMQGVRSVLAWFKAYERPDVLLGKLPYWSFVDWAPEGVTIPSYDGAGQSCLVSLEYLGALEEARDLEAHGGSGTEEAADAERAARVRKAIWSNCWDAGRGLLADSPDKTIFSQQGNALGVLYDAVPKERQQSVMSRMLRAPSKAAASAESPALIPATYYFDYYVARALEHAGMGDEYYGLLERWRALLKLHFTTWPEIPENPRSDCHAWSADPTIDLLRIVAGIRPAGDGFASVLIEPHLGPLKRLDAAVPHSQGLIHVRYTVARDVLTATVTLPGSVTGTFSWKGTTRPLHRGLNQFEIKPAAARGPD